MLPAMKFSIENRPIPTPTCFFCKVLEIELDIAMSIKDCPTLPKIRKVEMISGEPPVNVESKTKQVTNNPHATKNRYEFPFKSASLPPFRPKTAEATAPGTIAMPIQAGCN